MNKNKKIWIGVISLGLALLLFAVLIMIQQSMLEEPEYANVICAKTTIPENMELSEKNIDLYVEAREIPVMWLPEGYISDLEQLYGMITEGDIAQGSILSKTAFSAQQEYYDTYQELNWISVPINALYEGVAGSLRPGDYIDIYLLREEEEQYYCDLLAEGVRIEAAYSSQGEEIGVNSFGGLTQLIVIPIEKGNTAEFYEKLAQGNIRIAQYEAG